MDRLSLNVLTHLFELLTAKDVAQLTTTCTALHPREQVVQDAVALVVKHRFGGVLANLREDDASWPRAVATLRAAEVMTLKKWIASASVQSYEDAASACSSKASVIVSKAWLLAWKKRCQGYEQFLMQFRHTKKKQQQRERLQQTRTGRTALSQQPAVKKFVDTEVAATREAADMIVCPHGEMLPVSLCVGRSKRVVVSKPLFNKLSLYASDLRGFPLYSSDCSVCSQEKEEREKEAEIHKQERFESQIAGSNDLLDLLLRKSGYPNELFSPASTRGNTHLSLSHCVGKTYFLVPKKWLIKWRKFVRSLGDDYPGPILNSELVCLAHQRNVVPPYITMFLSGFSIEQSLQATQAYVFKLVCWLVDDND